MMRTSFTSATDELTESEAMDTLAEYVDGLLNLCGQEPLVSEAIEAAGSAQCS